MRRTFLPLVAAGLLASGAMSIPAGAIAAEPLHLTDQQLDDLTAGYSFAQIVAQALATGRSSYAGTQTQTDVIDNGAVVFVSTRGTAQAIAGNGGSAAATLESTVITGSSGGSGFWSRFVR